MEKEKAVNLIFSGAFLLILGHTLMNLIFTILHLPKDLIPSFLFFIFVYKGMEQIQECSVFIKARKETLIGMVLTGIAWVGHLLQTAIMRDASDSAVFFLILLFTMFVEIIAFGFYMLVLYRIPQGMIELEQTVQMGLNGRMMNRAWGGILAFTFLTVLGGIISVVSLLGMLFSQILYLALLLSATKHWNKRGA